MKTQRRVFVMVLWTITAIAGCQFCDTGSHKRVEQMPSASLPAPTRSGIVAITPVNSSIEFTGATALKSQVGHFAAFDGAIEMPSDDPKDAKIRVVVDMDSTTTSIGLLTRHLKGEDFFSVAKYPKAEFTSTVIAPGSEPGTYRVAGMLTLHGVQRSVECPARITVTPAEVTFDGTLTIRQTDFGMTESARKTNDEVPVRILIRGRRK